MSSESAVTVDSPSDVSLAVGSSQHKVYYYKKIEKTLYKGMAECVEQWPDIPPSITWVLLGDSGQKEIVAKVKRFLRYGQCRLNIEDQNQVDLLTNGFVEMILADMTLPPPEPKKRSPKNSNKSAAGNSLLKTAICHSRVERQTKSPIL